MKPRVNFSKVRHPFGTGGLGSWPMAAVAAAILWALGGALHPAAAVNDDVLKAGAVEYQTSCAVCHGATAEGGGPLAKHLKGQPANLRLLTQAGGGKFPFWDVFNAIYEGQAIAGHGSGEMPVWGDRYRREDPGVGVARARARVLELVFYLESIQDSN